MTALASLRRRDGASFPSGRAPAIDLSPLVGNWVNTETRSHWIARVVVRDDSGTLLIHPFGQGGDWGERPATMVCATGVTSAEGAAWVADFSNSRIEAMVHGGLLVLVAFTGSRFTREFFRRSS